MADNLQEFKAVAAVVALLHSKLAAATVAAAPIIDYYDTNDESTQHRIEVSCPSALAESWMPVGNFIGTLEVEVHSQWRSPSELATVFANHKAYTGEVRDVLSDTDIIANLNAVASVLTVQHVMNGREYTTSKGEFYITSLTRMRLACAPQ